jgi:hypothetical protein
MLRAAGLALSAVRRFEQGEGQHEGAGVVGALIKKTLMKAPVAIPAHQMYMLKNGSRISVRKCL